MRRVALVAFDDLTNRGVSAETTRAVQVRLKQDLGSRLEIDAVLPRPGKFLGAGWCRTKVRDAGVQGFITGKITGYSLQRDRRRAWVSLNFQLLNSEGRILWSKSAVGTAAIVPDRSLESLFEEAAMFATREFTDDFIPPQKKPETQGVRAPGVAAR